MENPPRKKILFFFYGDLFPANAGNKRLATDLLRYLKSAGSFHVSLVLVANQLHCREEVEALCDELVVFSEPVYSFPLHLANYPFSLTGITAWQVFVFARWLKIKMRPLCQKSDYIMINYFCWHQAVPRSCRQKTVIITHDLQFFRRQSFAGTAGGWWQRFHHFLNQKSELAVLKNFRAAVMLADYECQLLLKLGFPPSQIIKIGMPLQPGEILSGMTERYDFLMVGGNSAQNIAGLRYFMENIAARLPAYGAIAIAGGMCNSDYCQELARQDSRVKLLGFVDNLGQIYAESKLVVATMTIGSGIKVKVVEAMLYAKCVISTNKGLEGIPWCEKSVFNCSLHPRDEAGVIIQALLQNDQLRSAFGHCARQLVSAEFSPVRVLRELSADIEKAGTDR